MACSRHDRPCSPGPCYMLSATQPALPEGSPPKPQRFRLSPKQCETQDRESWQRGTGYKVGQDGTRPDAHSYQRAAPTTTSFNSPGLHPSMPTPENPARSLPRVLQCFFGCLTHPSPPLCFFFFVLCSDATPGLGDHSVLGLKPTT